MYIQEYISLKDEFQRPYLYGTEYPDILSQHWFLFLFTIHGKTQLSWTNQISSILSISNISHRNHKGDQLYIYIFFCIILQLSFLFNRKYTLNIWLGLCISYIWLPWELSLACPPPPRCRCCSWADCVSVSAFSPRGRWKQRWRRSGVWEPRDRRSHS